MTALADFQAANRTKINTGAIRNEGTAQFMPDSDVKMSLSEEALAPLLDLLTNLYSKPYLATLREVSSNAADAHAKLRQVTNGEDGNRPIEVSMPSSLNPVLTIRDYGIGMDEHTLFNVYPKYGSSTKAEDMDQLGAYGLGAKTPLTLSSQYTIETIKDGIKNVVLVKMGDDRIGVMHPISTEETDEHSGTTIKVPIPNVNQFNQESRGFFSTWKPGTVLVDGVEPKSIYNDQAISLADDRVVIIPKRDRYSDAQFVVTIAGVAYPVNLSNAGLVPQNQWSNDLDLYEHFAVGSRNMGFSIIHEIPIGVIDLVPAREDLRYTERTKEALAEAFKNGIDLLPEAINKAVSGAETRTEALRQASYWKDTIKALRRFKKVDDKTEMKWNGSVIPADIIEDDAELMLVTYKDERVSRHDNIKANVSFLTSDKTMFYTVSTLDSSSILSRIRQFIKGRNLDLDDVMFYVFREEPQNKWITDNTDIEFVQWDDVVEGSRDFMRKQREQKRKDKEAGIVPADEGPSALTYRMLTVNADDKFVGKDVAAKDMTGTIYYLGENTIGHSTELYREIVRQFGKDVQIVVIPTTRKVDAFLKRLPQSVTARPAVQSVTTAVREKVDALPLNHRINLALRVNKGVYYHSSISYRVMRNLDLIYKVADEIVGSKNEIADEALVSLAETLGDRVSKDEEKEWRRSLTQATNSINYLQQALRDENQSYLEVADDFLTHLIKDYPLLIAEDILHREKAAAHVIPYIKLVSNQNL